MPASRVLVTGAAGFIGSHLCEALAGSGREVLGIDNFDPYYSPLDKQGNVRVIQRAGARFQELDVCDDAGLSRLVSDFAPDVVVHLAAKAGVRNSVQYPRDYFLANALGTQNVLDVCRDHDVERIVMASTSSVYGNTEQLPFHESDPCVRPLHPYAATKRSTELLAQTYSHLYDLQATVLRFFTVYGERGRPDMMPRMLLDSISHRTPVKLFDGPLERDWTHVSDIAAGLVEAVDRPLGFEILNLGRGQPVALRSFIDELELVSGRAANLVPTPRPDSEMLVTFADNRRLVSLLGVEPRVSVPAGVAALWDWWQQSLAA